MNTADVLQIIFTAGIFLIALLSYVDKSDKKTATLLMHSKVADTV